MKRWEWEIGHMGVMWLNGDAHRQHMKFARHGKHIVGMVALVTMALLGSGGLDAVQACYSPYYDSWWYRVAVSPWGTYGGWILYVTGITRTLTAQKWWDISMGVAVALLGLSIVHSSNIV